MKKAVLAVAVAVMLYIVCPSCVYSNAEDQSEVTKLVKELQRAKVEQVAMVIDSLSDAKLLIRSGVGRDPKVGHPVRDLKWGDMLFITVYPASKLVTAELDGLDECTLLGAVTVLAPAMGPPPATGSLASRIAEPGVYLLAAKAGKEEGKADVLLVSVRVDDKGDVVFKEAARAAATVDTDPRIAGAVPGVIVAFQESPPMKVTVKMTWAEAAYEFTLDLFISFR